MAQINLLPWREERRQALKKEFLVTVALVLALAAGVVLMADRIVASQIDSTSISLTRKPRPSLRM